MIRSFVSIFLQKSLVLVLILPLFLLFSSFIAHYFNNRFIEFLYTYSANSVELLLISFSVLFSCTVVLFRHRLPSAWLSSPGLDLFSTIYFILIPVSLITSPFLLSRLTLIFLFIYPSAPFFL